MMKRYLKYLSLFLCSSISLATVACQVTVINNLNNPVVVIDGVKGDVDALGTVNEQIANQIYQTKKFKKYRIMPGQSKKIGHPHVHAHFLLGMNKINGMQWFEVSQYQCTGRPHETIKANQIVQQNLGSLRSHFGVKKLN